jgi:hydroxymethylpyrimidine/phosphomethylpyrimidine kinase
MAANPEVPVALTIAGSDSSAGAGIQADLKTFGALGVYGLTAITGIVAERPGLVSEIEAVSA